jgi:hypothetical protein
VFDIEDVEERVSGGVGELGLDNTAAPQDGNVKFTITPKGGALGGDVANADFHPSGYFLSVRHVRGERPVSDLKKAENTAVDL